MTNYQIQLVSIIYMILDVKALLFLEGIFGKILSKKLSGNRSDKMCPVQMSVLGKLPPG